MNRRIEVKRSQATLTICGVIAGVVGSAHADQVYVDYMGTSENVGDGVAVSLSGGLTFWDGSTSKTLWAGQRSIEVDGEMVKAYSAELTARAGTGWHDQLEANDALGGMKASAIDNLFAATDGGTFESADEAVAFQALLWEVLYDYDGSEGSVDLHGGRVAFGMVDESVFESLKASLGMRGGSDPELAVISSDVFGDHFRFGNNPRIIPLPSAAALAGAGLLTLGARRRRV
jgi:hypothetical protein